MKKIMILFLTLALVFSLGISAVNAQEARVTVLKAKAVIKTFYEYKDGSWNNLTNDVGDRHFLVIEAEPPDSAWEDQYNINYLELIITWKEGGGKYYERYTIGEDPDTIVYMVDLGKNDKVALTVDMRHSELGAMMVLKGKVNKKGYIKFLKGFLNAVNYDPDLSSFETLELNYQRIKKFDDPNITTGSDMADAIVEFLEGKGFVENTGD
ncbi:MAG: hypothetical protein DRH12_17360 [Deltaproteobacteria bacterium]|nr:MAG: hypothetical protein DRH12_17360 [Deltaproteobacteria bacterium]